MRKNILGSVIVVACALPACAVGQQWYNASPQATTGFRMYGAAFTVNGKGWFGCGEDALFALDGAWRYYDPATNTVTNSMFGFGMRSHLVGFALGNHGYFGLGNLGDPWGMTPTYVTGYIAKFDPVTEQVVGFIADFPPGPRLDAIAFTIGNKAYVGGGMDVDSAMGTSAPVNDLWEYDPLADTWTSRASLPAFVLQGGATFTVNGKGYLNPRGTNDLWEYDPLANTWTVRAPVPGLTYSGRVAFSVNGLGYVGCGNWGTDTQAFHVYDPSTNTWGPAPAMWYWTGRHDALSFVIGNDAYVLGGQRQGYSALLGDLWRFGAATTPAANAWTQRPYVPGPVRERPIAFTIGDKGYAGGGTDFPNALTDFYMYDPVTQTWTARANLPATQADEGFSIDGIGYVVTATATSNFFAYDPATNSWASRADMPGGARSAGASFAMEGKGYVGGGLIGGVRTNTFYRYDPTTDTWTQRANVPALRHSSCGFAIGNKGYIVNGNIAGSSTTSGIMYRYDPVLDTWTQVAQYPYNTNGNQNSMCFTVGNRAYLGGGLVGGPTLSRHFHVYDAVANTWTLLPWTGGGYRYNGVGFSVGDKGYLFAGRLEPDTISPFLNNAEESNDLWEFNPAVISVSPRVFLEGCFVQGTGTMHDSLRVAGLLNTLDPYGANGYPYPGGNYSDLPVQLPTTTGNNAVVDRVVVEVREAAAPYAVKASRSLWLQRDGDVVDMDGLSAPRFTLAPGNYQLAVRHRNHLGAMTSTAVALSSTPSVVDLTLTGTPTFGTDARKQIGSSMLLWSGDVTFNGQLKYAGALNDRDPILVRIGGSNPLNTVAGYFAEDVNLNGTVKYVGAGNDRDPILQNIGGLNPLSTRAAQLP